MKTLVFDSHPKIPRTFLENLERTLEVEEGSGVRPGGASNNRSPLR